MPTTYARPDFAVGDAKRLLESLYGFGGRCTPLPGERDRNFHVHAEDGAQYVLKISGAHEERPLLEMQHAAMRHIATHAPMSTGERAIEVPGVVPARNGEPIAAMEGPGSGHHFVRLLRWLEGKPLALTSPHSSPLLHSLGSGLGSMACALADFAHPAAHRSFKWDLVRAAWIRDFVHHMGDADQRRLVASQVDEFEAHILPRLQQTRSSVVHGDANDYNVLTRRPGDEPASVIGFIDFGDLVASHAICDLAIALAYVMMDKPDPLSAAVDVVAGYHALLPLTGEELELLVPLARTRLCVTVANAAYQRQAEPLNVYLQISERGAWSLLDALDQIPARYAVYRFRDACGLTPCPASPRVAAWLSASRDVLAPIVEPSLDGTEVPVLDLSVSSDELGPLDEWTDADRFTRRLFDRIRDTRGSLGTNGPGATAAAGPAVAIGRYDEVRALYSVDAFRVPGNDGPENRSVHIGIDLFLDAGAPVYAPLAGRVRSLRDNAHPLDYGPTIVLEHVVDGGGLTFYTLYGHLSRESLGLLRRGQEVGAGDRIGTIGDQRVNGGWPPHLHFQIICDLLGREGEFPGVARPRERDVWLSLSPDPALMVRLPASARAKPPLANDVLLARRRDHIGPSLSISYRQPLHIVRGAMQYLIDVTGRRYLDAVNNVAHVGHAHPSVVRAGQRQMAVLNTNTRYLHDHLVEYAERLTATLPEPLSVCYFVCSGSEANELALRLARAHTGAEDMVVVEAGYHGNTSTLVDVSSYKFDGPGGRGAPPWVHKVSMPDTYRGAIRRDNAAAGALYAEQVGDAVREITRNGRRVRGFLAESVLSCGGQIVLPPGYLAESYAHVREGGGVCIADEVQVGFGRVGSHFWGFETQGVVPDIVTMGKPIGNGHPMAAVVTTPQIAASFANGMEFFSTFGGNPVSCAIGLAVLHVIEREGLQGRALEVGHHLMRELQALASRHEIIGDVRGLGLFVGVELVSDRERLTPATRQAGYVANRMKDGGVLLSTDGPFNNVLKIKPPLCFTRDDADFLVATLDRVLSEDPSAATP